MAIDKDKNKKWLCVDTYIPQSKSKDTKRKQNKA